MFYVHDFDFIRLILLAAAIACGIALSDQRHLENEVPNAVEKACKYIEAGISLSSELGHGNGPINHFHSIAVQLPSPFTSSLRRSIYQGTNKVGLDPSMPEKG